MSHGVRVRGGFGEARTYFNPRAWYPGASIYRACATMTEDSGHGPAYQACMVEAQAYEAAHPGTIPELANLPGTVPQPPAGAGATDTPAGETPVVTEKKLEAQGLGTGATVGIVAALAIAAGLALSMRGKKP